MIIVRIYEGLGNQLFQYAYARTVSLSTNQKVLLDIRETGSLLKEKDKVKRNYELNNFKICLPICKNTHLFYPYLNNEVVLNKVKTLSKFFNIPFKYFEESSLEYDSKLLKLNGNWYLQGWFQNENYFKTYETIIKKDLVPRRKIKINHKLRTILQIENTVSIHVRRSDFKKSLNILPLTYYYNAIKYIFSRISNPFWVIFSDDIEWVKNNIDFGTNSYFIDKKQNLQDYEELMIMSCCKHNIIANSTYSWWGAWLNKNKNKIVIGPEIWFLRGNININIMPKEWIRISIN